MDVLSNVLHVSNLIAHTRGARELLAPWGLRVDAADCCVIHVIGRGSAWLRRPGSDPVRLNAGDVVLVASGDGHALVSDPAVQELEPLEPVSSPASGQLVAPRATPSAGEPTLLQSACYELSKEGQHPLLSLLPPLIRIPAERTTADGDLQLLLRLLAREATQRDAGAERLLPRLTDALFVYLVRSWLREQPEGTCGWLGALRDTQIGKALALIHERPQEPWTVEGLARAVAMSRAAFAMRFTELVGEPPLAYVTRWRMDLAAKLLRESREPVARIAGKVGYISETAFAKAFRRRRQLAPGAYRYQRRASAALRAPLGAQ